MVRGVVRVQVIGIGNLHIQTHLDRRINAKLLREITPYISFHLLCVKTKQKLK